MPSIYTYIFTSKIIPNISKNYEFLILFKMARKIIVQLQIINVTKFLQTKTYT